MSPDKKKKKRSKSGCKQTGWQSTQKKEEANSWRGDEEEMAITFTRPSRGARGGGGGGGGVGSRGGRGEGR